MSDSIYIEAKGRNGENLLCPFNAAKNRVNMTDNEPKECLEKDVSQRYSGNFIVLH